MNIGELFVTLGITGAPKVKKDLNSVGAEMRGLTKRGLAVFTAIAGISYGLKQLSSAATNSGNRLTKFSNLTGLSAEKLQAWQYIARQSGVAADEVTANVESISSAISDMIKTGQFSGEFLRIAEITNIDPSKLEDTFYILEKFREFTKSGLPVGQVNSILQPFLSQDLIQALRSNDMTIDQVPKSALMSSGAAKRLQGLQIAGANLQNKLENSVAKVLAEVGPELIRKLNALIPVLTDLTKAVLLSIGNFAEFASDPGGQIKNAATGLMEPGVWKQIFEDALPWTTAKLREFSAPELADRWSREIQNMQTGATDTHITINQTNHGVSARDANTIGEKTAGAVRKVPTLQQLKTQKAVN